MKKLILIASIFALTSCGTRIVTTGEHPKSGEAEFTVMKVGECEYLFRNYDRGCMFTHKGDCKNPIHKYNEN